MRAIEFITEATFDNMNIIRAIADRVMSKLDQRLEYYDGDFSKHDLIVMHGGGIIDAIDRDYAENQPQLHKRYAKAFEAIRNSKFMFISDESHSVVRKAMNSEGKLPQGVFMPNADGSGNIVVFIRAFFRYDEVPEFFKTSDASVKRLLHSTLVHEIRHLFQFADAPEYMTGDAFKHPYASRNIEIDAVWTQALMQHVSTPYQTAESFVRKVMGDLTRRKKLSKEQITQYARKTLRYFSDHVQSDPAALKIDREERKGRASRELEIVMPEYEEAIALVPISGTSTEYANAVIAKMIQIDDTLEYMVPETVAQLKVMATKRHYEKTHR